MMRPAMMPAGMCAVAPNGQMMMANQVQIGNAAHLQGKPLLHSISHFFRLFCLYDVTALSDDVIRQKRGHFTFARNYKKSLKIRYNSFLG